MPQQVVPGAALPVAAGPQPVPAAPQAYPAAVPQHMPVSAAHNATVQPGQPEGAAVLLTSAGAPVPAGAAEAYGYQVAAAGPVPGNAGLQAINQQLSQSIVDSSVSKSRAALRESGTKQKLEPFFAGAQESPMRSEDLLQAVASGRVRLERFRGIAEDLELADDGAVQGLLVRLAQIEQGVAAAGRGGGDLAAALDAQNAAFMQWEADLQAEVDRLKAIQAR